MKRALLRGASAATMVVVSGFWASQAMAQAGGATAGGSHPPGAGEVIVTAQRRNQAIEHVPVAVSAFTAKQRDLLGIQTVQQLSDFTPGLSYYAIADRAYIRGIGRNTINLATESGVATYYNGIYYGANATIALSHDTAVHRPDRGRPRTAEHPARLERRRRHRSTTSRPGRPMHFYAEARVGRSDYGE